MIVGLTGKIDDPKPKKWQTCKRNLQLSTEEIKASKADKKKYAAARHAPKQNHALQWLTEVAQYSSDFSVNAGEEDRKIIPYGSVPEMWREYKSESLKVKKVCI